MPIVGLSGLRGLALLIIIYYHLHQVRSTEGLALWDWGAYQFSALLPVVVCVFFLLGGFLRSLSYWRVISEGGEVPSFSRGLRDRLFRIAPLYYIILIVSFFWSLFLAQADLQSFLVGFTFLSWMSPETFFPVMQNGPLWFVAYDMMGNILVMIVMSLIVHSAQKTIHRKQGIIVSFCLTFFILLALHFVFVSLPWQEGNGIVALWFPHYSPFIFGVQYIMGAMIGGVYHYYRNREKSILGDVAFIGSMISIGVFLVSILGASDLAYSWPESPYRFPIVPILFTLLILGLLFSRYSARLLDNRLFLFIAAISYPLYLIHALIIDMLRYFLFGYVPMTHGKWELFSGIVVILSILIAWGLTKGEGFLMSKLKK